MPRKYILIIAMLSWLLQTNAQDSPMTQWFNNQHMSNPSMAGAARQLRLNIFYRNQWPKASAGFEYYGVSADMPINKSMGVGIGMSNDHTSAFSKPSLFGTYSYAIKTGLQSELRFGIKIGVLQKYVSASGLTFEQDEFVPNKSSGVKPDAGIGISASTSKFFAGATLDHLMRPKQNIAGDFESRTYIKMTVNAGYIHQIRTLNTKKEIEIMPVFIFQRQGTQQNLQFAVIGQVDCILMGTSVRKNLSTDPPTSSIILGYKTLDFKIAYNYDIEMNKKTTKMGNAHEVSITKLFDTKRKEKHKSIDCPSFLR
ncbi:MAG: type IX secretion system membrane protein PorP/SprF [Salinivirgaceae bacterium]|nr:type IX secretion system membrane protein PorP/SprF [Salinivirgaceae bacterium]